MAVPYHVYIKLLCLRTIHYRRSHRLMVWKKKRKKRIWLVKQICSKCSLGCQDRELNIIPGLHKTLSADADQPRFICKETSKLDWITFSIKLKINNNNTDLPLVCHKCHMFISLSQHCPVCEDHPLMEWSPEKWARSCGKGGKFPTQLKIECQLKNRWKKNPAIVLTC